MTEHDDAWLAAHLRRRTSEPPSASMMTSAIMRRLDDEPQVAPWRSRLGAWRAPAFSAAALVVAVIAVAYLAGFTTLPSDPAAPTAPSPTGVASEPPGLEGDVTILTLADLERVLGSGRWLGHVVIADVHIRTDVTFDCDGECPVGHVDSSDPMIPVYGTLDRGERAPVALRVTGQWRVDLVGNVLPPEGGRPTWTVPELTSWLATRRPFSPQTYAVEGWLTEGLPLPCPAPLEPTAPPDFDYGCGIATWLGPEAVTSPRADAPDGAIRLQNHAYDTHASQGSGVYLIEPVSADPCSGCPDGTAFHLVARVDPIDPAIFGAVPSVRTGAVAIRTIFDDPAWHADPMPVEDVVLCRGASECGSATLLYRGVDAPPSDVDFSKETMLRIVNGVPLSVTWNGSVLEITIARHTTGFWEGAIGIDLGDIPNYELSVVYVICARADGPCERT